MSRDAKGQVGTSCWLVLGMLSFVLAGCTGGNRADRDSVTPPSQEARGPDPAAVAGVWVWDRELQLGEGVAQLRVRESIDAASAGKSAADAEPAATFPNLRLELVPPDTSGQALSTAWRIKVTNTEPGGEGDASEGPAQVITWVSPDKMLEQKTRRLQGQSPLAETKRDTLYLVATLPPLFGADGSGDVARNSLHHALWLSSDGESLTIDSFQLGELGGQAFMRLSNEHIRGVFRRLGPESSE